MGPIIPLFVEGVVLLGVVAVSVRWSARRERERILSRLKMMGTDAGHGAPENQEERMLRRVLESREMEAKNERSFLKTRIKIAEISSQISCLEISDCLTEAEKILKTAFGDKGKEIAVMPYKNFVRESRPSEEYCLVPIERDNQKVAMIVAPRWAEEQRTLSLLEDAAGRIGKLLGQMQTIERLTNESIRDPMTGIYNRRYLEEFYQHVQGLITNRGLYHTFIVLDIDHFKKINDVHGHLTGDEIIKNIATLITRNIRVGDDMPVRLGGEEFGIVVASSVTNAYWISEKIRQKVAKATHLVNGSSIHYTVSIGIAPIMIGKTLSETIKEADDALYRAKRAGRNRTIVARTEDESW